MRQLYFDAAVYDYLYVMYLIQSLDSVYTIMKCNALVDNSAADRYFLWDPDAINISSSGIVPCP